VVRGLDYYTKTIFEIWPIDEKENDKGKKSALGGGGRYDGLVEELGGQSTPACGMAFGVERIIVQLKENSTAFPPSKGIDVFLVQVGAAARKKCLSLFEELRTSKIKVAESLSKNGLRQQLDKANKLKAKFSLILGQQELLDGTIIMRNMEDGTQETVNMDKVVDQIRKKMQTSKVKRTKLKK
jgi:histidyl-tRNA synthetase